MGFFQDIRQKAFRVYNSRTNVVVETFNVTFLENSFPDIVNGPACLFDVDSLSNYFKSILFYPAGDSKQKSGDLGDFSDDSDDDDTPSDSDQAYPFLSFSDNRHSPQLPVNQFQLQRIQMLLRMMVMRKFKKSLKPHLIQRVKHSLTTLTTLSTRHHKYLISLLRHLHLWMI